MAEVSLFGFKFGKNEDPRKEAVNIPSFTPPPNEDAAIDLDLALGGGYGSFVDMEGAAKNEAELVTKYRDITLQAEVERAVDEICSDAIIFEDNQPPVEINLEDIDAPEKIKDRIREEFKTIINLLDFDNMGYDIFRRWYIDGRMYYHMMIDKTAPRDGIKEVRYVDPRRIKKVRKSIAVKPAEKGAGERTQAIAPAFEEFYLYMASGATGVNWTRGVKISKDSIAYVHSGILNPKNTMVLSHLQKAIKPMNQLRMLEDAVVIYRLARAPERRVFYIDVGNLPKMKAEQYLKDMMTRHKNRLVYDAATGQITDNRKFMTMLEDFWLPRREGSRGTEISTLQAGQNLGQMEDVMYFKEKLYKALNVPVTRLQPETQFTFGTSGTITRDEIKFSKFIDRLRMRFSHLFDILLETQLVLRGVMSRDEFKKFKENIHYDFQRDNYYAEIKEQEIMNQRLAILQNADNYVGRYYSVKWIRENALKQSEEDIKAIDKEISKEEQDPRLTQQDEGEQESQDQMGWNSDGSKPVPIDPTTPANSTPRVGPVKGKTKEPPSKKVKVGEEYVPRKELTTEEKKLIESMTELLDSVNDDSDIDIEAFEETENVK